MITTPFYLRFFILLWGLFIFVSVGSIIRGARIRWWLSVMQEQDDVARVEDADAEQVLAKELHGKYFARCLNALPSSLATLDAIRLSIAFFAISGMDVLGKLNLIDKSREEIIDWIYRFQITSPSFENNNEACGFRGSLAAVSSLNPPGSPSEHPLDTSHVTMTYAALNTLLILGDDLSRVNKKAVTCGIKALQLPNGRLAHNT